MVLKLELIPNAGPAACRLPSSEISGPDGFVSPPKTVWLEPSIVVPLSVSGGSGDVGLIVQTPRLQPGSIGGIANVTESGPGFAFANSIAARSEPGPLSFVLITTL